MPAKREGDCCPARMLSFEEAQASGHRRIARSGSVACPRQLPPRMPPAPGLPTRAGCRAQQQRIYRQDTACPLRASTARSDGSVRRLPHGRRRTRARRSDGPAGRVRQPAGCAVDVLQAKRRSRPAPSTRRSLSRARPTVMVTQFMIAWPVRNSAARSNIWIGTTIRSKPRTTWPSTASRSSTSTSVTVRLASLRSRSQM